MKRIEDLTLDEMRALKPGEEIVTEVLQAPDYRHMNADMTIVAGFGPGTLSVIVLQSRPGPLSMVATVEAQAGNQFTARTTRNEFKPALFQLCSFAIHTDQAGELARSILDQLDQMDPKLADQTVADFIEIRASRQKPAT